MFMLSSYFLVACMCQMAAIIILLIAIFIQFTHIMYIYLLILHWIYIGYLLIY